MLEKGLIFLLLRKGGRVVLLVTITNWKHKLGVLFRLFLFLLLIGLVIPQFLSLIAGELAELKGRSEITKPPAMRVEKEKAEAEPSSELTILERLRQLYYGNEGKESTQDR
jgi:hypothetical protein